jgi:small subunit ribosomal protein S2
VDYVIPANDDASKSIDKILSLVTAAITEGLSDRGADKEVAEAIDAKGDDVTVTEEATPEVATPETSTEA